MDDPRDCWRGVELEVVACSARSGARLAGELEPSRERELRGFQPESLVRDPVRRVVHGVEGVVPGKSRIVVAVPLHERDRGNPGEAERGGVENGRTAQSELRHEWRNADRVAIIRGNHSVPKCGRSVRVVAEMEPGG